MTLPPLFPVENDKSNNGVSSIDDSKRHVADILQKVLKERFPDEDFSNSMTIGLTSKIIGLRKNNLRRYVELLPVSYSGLENLKTTIRCTKECRIKNYSEHNKLLTIYFDGVLLQLGRKKLVAIFEQVRDLNGEKGCIKKQVRSVQEGRDFIINTIEETRVLLDSVLEHFCGKYDLKFGKIDWMRAEKGYFGDRFLDAIPAETIFHSEKLRKLYPHECEGISGKDEDATIDAVNFYGNRLKEDWFAQDILPAFVSRMDSSEARFSKALDALTEQLSLHLAVEKSTQVALAGQLEVQGETLKTLKGIRSGLKKKRFLKRKGKSYRLARARSLLKDYGW